MKQCILILALIAVVGCTPKPPQEKVLVQVGDYVITEEDFIEAYRNSAYAVHDSLESKKEFLDNMINQKLILLDAQKQGLDKEKEFLKMIENFWQQSLLTVAIQEKSKANVSIDNWLEDLKKNTTITINGEYLK